MEQKKKERIATKVSKKVNQYDLQGNFIRTWNNGKEIEKELGINIIHIGDVCNGKRKTSYGFKWEFCREEE